MQLETYVRQMTWESDEVLVVELAAVDDDKLPGWEPGAHIGLLLPAGVRHYSLCGSPQDTRTYRVGVLREEASRGGSAQIHDVLRPGHVLEITPPQNHFSLVSAPAYRFLAGGIGVTPFVPMIAALAAAGAEWRMAYVGRSRYSMAFVEELESYGPAVTVIAREESPRPDLAELLAEPRAGECLYVCGPPALVEAARAAADQLGWPESAVHSERFVPVELDTSADSSFEVSCRASGAQFTVSARDTLADALASHGIEVETACREGICGTCRVAVLSGAIEHRDAVLDAGERAAGKALLACVSRGLDQLVLDI